mgnify:FL=1
MAKLKTSRIVKVICDTCHGNGYVRVAKIDGDPSRDFRDRSEVHQCWDCDSEGEYYVHEPQAIQPDNTIDPATGNVVKLN